MASYPSGIDTNGHHSHLESITYCSPTVIPNPLEGELLHSNSEHERHWTI